MFLDRTLVRVNERGVVEQMADLDLQFRIYYQFLKHAFGMSSLPQPAAGKPHRILVRLDDHSSQKHKTALASFVEKLSSKTHTIQVTFRNSASSCRLQICDLLIGAAGSYGNKMHLRREPGRSGMSSNQKARRELAKYIYDRLRAIDAAERGTAAFNWFETTGRGGDADNVYRHKLRIWKFKPTKFHVDKGWQNDHLDKQGRYQGPDIYRPLPVDADEDETFDDDETF
jgi:hypothetical protein